MVFADEAVASTPPSLDEQVPCSRIGTATKIDDTASTRHQISRRRPTATLALDVEFGCVTLSDMIPPQTFIYSHA